MTHRDAREGEKEVFWRERKNNKRKKPLSFLCFVNRKSSLIYNISNIFSGNSHFFRKLLCTEANSFSGNYILVESCCVQRQLIFQDIDMFPKAVVYGGKQVLWKLTFPPKWLCTEANSFSEHLYFSESCCVRRKNPFQK